MRLCAPPAWQPGVPAGPNSNLRFPAVTPDCAKPPTGNDEIVTLAGHNETVLIGKQIPPPFPWANLEGRAHLPEIPEGPRHATRGTEAAGR
jgi:hypothetical protein